MPGVGGKYFAGSIGLRLNYVFETSQISFKFYGSTCKVEPAEKERDCFRRKLLNHSIEVMCDETACNLFIYFFSAAFYMLLHLPFFVAAKYIQ